MQVRLNVNGVEFTPWLAENGYVLTPLIRQSRSVVVRNGTEYRAEIHKHQLDATLVEVRDGTLATLSAALDKSPATVLFTDDHQQLLTRTMYVTGPTATAKTVRGGNTYFSGVTFTFEEM